MFISTKRFIFILPLFFLLFFYKDAIGQYYGQYNRAMIETQSPEQRQIYNQNQIASLQKQNEYLSQATYHEQKYADAVHKGLFGAIMGIFDKDYDADYQAIMANNARARANTEAKIGQNQAQAQAVSLLTANGVNPLTQGWTNEVDQWAQQYSQQLTAQKEANARKAAGANDAYKAVTDRLNTLRQLQAEVNEPRKQIMAEAQYRREANVRLEEEKGRNERAVREAELQNKILEQRKVEEAGRNARLDKQLSNDKAQQKCGYENVCGYKKKCRNEYICGHKYECGYDDGNGNECGYVYECENKYRCDNYYNNCGYEYECEQKYKCEYNCGYKYRCGYEEKCDDIWDCDFEWICK